MIDNKTVLRARDFWTSLVLLAVSIFFLYRTSFIPFFDNVTAGVESAQWYDSAALVPYGIFGGLLLLSLTLLYISIKDGGAKVALTAVGLDIDVSELKRLFLISLILFAYIFGLVPRVDFIICSALLIAAMIWGFHKGLRPATYIATGLVAIPGIYATIMNFGIAHWAKPLNDDWVTLACLAMLIVCMLKIERRDGRYDVITKLTPVISIMVPLSLVLVMAFGFRQNVPNRTGLLFKQIEYHYYVNIRPIWQNK